MKYVIIFILIFSFSVQEETPKLIPSDLKKIGISDFYEPDEILRIWRFPEGGAIFEELIEIKRNGKKWNSIRYTYLLDEYSDDPELQKFRTKQNLNLSRQQILKFTNDKLLLKTVKSTEEDQICLCDSYLGEYRNNNRANYFKFFLDEVGNSNSAKIDLITFLDEIIEE